MSSSFAKMLLLARTAVNMSMARVAEFKLAKQNGKTAPKNDKPKVAGSGTYRKDDPKSRGFLRRDMHWLRFGGGWRPLRDASPAAQRIVMRKAVLKREWRALRNLGEATVSLAEYTARGLEA